jgi:hypothetical protein
VGLVLEDLVRDMEFLEDGLASKFFPFFIFLFLFLVFLRLDWLLDKIGYKVYKSIPNILKVYKSIPNILKV